MMDDINNAFRFSVVLLKPLQRSIYHFDPTNLPPNHKLPPAMPANESALSPGSSSSSSQYSRKRGGPRPNNDGREQNDGKNQICDEIVKPDIEISPIPSDDLKCETELAFIEQSTNATNTVLCSSMNQLELSPKPAEDTIESNIAGNYWIFMSRLFFDSNLSDNFFVPTDNNELIEQAEPVVARISCSPPVKNQATSPNIPETINVEVNLLNLIISIHTYITIHISIIYANIFSNIICID